MNPYSTVPGFEWSMMASRSTSSDTSMFSTSPDSTLYGGFLPYGYHSLVGAYSGASFSKSSSNMSTGVINPTNEGLTSEQFINMIFGIVGNPQTNQTGGYYLPGGQPSYPPPEGQPFGGSYPTAGGKSPVDNYLNYDQIPQTGFGQSVMPQPTI